MGFAYRYAVTECPECGSNLTEVNAIDLETTDGVAARRHRTRLTMDGVLVDTNGLVRSGQHSETFCANCGESLVYYEEQFDPDSYDDTNGCRH